MSKFWGGDDSEESEEEDFFSDSEEDEQEQQQDTSANAGKWVQGAAYGSDDEDEKREVRAKHEKVNDALENAIEGIRSSMEENDWNTISKAFDDLAKIHQKWLSAWKRSAKKPAPQYIALLVDLAAFHKTCYGDNKYKKKLSNTNKKSVNGMQQKLKRNNSSYEKAMKDFETRKEKVAAGEIEEEDLIEEVTIEQPKVIEEEKKVEEPKEIIWTPELVDETLTEIISSRGRKGGDRVTQISRLEELLLQAQGNFQAVQILLQMVSLQFDATATTSHLGAKIWKDCIDIISKTIGLINTDPAVIKEKNPVKNSQTPAVDVQSSIIHYLDRLEQEFFKSLQDNDFQKVKSYVSRMRDVPVLLHLTKEVETLYTKLGDNESLVKAVLIRMKYQHQTVQLNESQENIELKASICEGMATGSEEEIEESAKLCFKLGDERQKTHAMIYYVTFLATHNNYAKARDLMLMSHIQDSISAADVITQILFNRAMALLGLCAFREGNISDCHNCLVDLYSSMKYKELLAQGVTRHADKGAEQEMIESRRQMPYHMHINTEILETVYFTCALLLEVPYSASRSFDSARKPISKILKKYLENNSRQVFAGPSEAPRDFFVAAAKALGRGDWKKCCALLFGLNVWDYMSDSATLKAMVTQKIKEEGVRTFLFSVGANYDSYDTKRLAEEFELDLETVYTLVSKMIVKEELQASWDDDSGCIIMQKMEPSKLQELTLQFAEKIGSLIENNEKIAEYKSGNRSRNQQRGKKEARRNANQ